MRITALLISGLLAAVSPWSSAAEDYEQARSKIMSVIPRAQIVDMQPTGVPGLIEVSFDNGKAVYSSLDGEYIIDGTLFQITDQGVVNLRKERQDARMRPLRKAALSRISDDEMVVFSPKGEVRATVYAFTDVDCGYCRKLHREIQAYNDLGIEIRYLAFPRAGVGSSSYDKMVAIWCADDRHQAMTDSKAGRSIPMKTCANPVSDQYTMGNRMGVTGTPSLLTAEGDMMPGYLPARQLAAALELNR